MSVRESMDQQMDKLWEGLCRPNQWGEVRWGEVRWGEVRWGEVRWANGRVRALCRTKLLPVTRVLVDTWMLTVKPVFKLSNVPHDLNRATNTHDTIYTHFQGITNNIYSFGRLFCTFISLPVHPYFYPSIFVFTRPNDGRTGLYIKLWEDPTCCLNLAMLCCCCLIAWICCNWTGVSGFWGRAPPGGHNTQHYTQTPSVATVTIYTCLAYPNTTWEQTHTAATQLIITEETNISLRNLRHYCNHEINWFGDSKMYRYINK